MKRTRSPSSLALAIMVAFLASGCVVQPTHPLDGYGPPPHAPAHGYRMKHQERDLRYDSNLGVYIVVDLPGFFFLDDVYYRHEHDRWYYSRQLDRNWHSCADSKLPPGLAKKYRHAKKSKHKGRH